MDNNKKPSEPLEPERWAKMENEITGEPKEIAALPCISSTRAAV